jgi:hypothetical protein
VDKEITTLGKAPPTKDSFTLHFEHKKFCANHPPKKKSSKEKQLLVVVAGPAGSGSEMVASYFHAGLKDKLLHIVSVKCRTTHKSLQYYIIKELMLGIIGLDKFTEEVCDQYMIDLVNGACDHFSADEKEHCRSRLRFILDMASEEDAHKHRKATPNDDLIPRVFAYLLRNSPQTAFIIEEAHNCDEVSWAELYAILNHKQLSIMVMVTVKSVDQAKVLDSIVQMCMSDFSGNTTVTVKAQGGGSEKKNAFNKKVDMNLDIFGDADSDVAPG